MMDCKCQEGFKVSLFVSHLLVLFCPVFYFTVSIKPTASSNYNTVIVLGLASAAKRQKTQRTKGGNEQRLVKESLQKKNHPQVLLNGRCPMNGGKSCKGESRNKRKCENTKPLHPLFWIIPLRELDFQLSFFALLLTILFLRNTNVRLSCFFFLIYIYCEKNKNLRMKRPLTKPERKKEKEKEVIMTAPQEAIVILRTNSLFFCVGVFKE